MSNYGKRMVPEYLLKRLEQLNSVELPVKIDNVTSIAALTDEEINSLEAGDIVVKKTGNQKHTYIVTYKEDKQGICLTYVDATYIETVSYDYTAGHWVYNSKDSIELQTLTAGDNITITDGVISATDTTYTAGDNITITNGVISASGGDVWESLVKVNFDTKGSFYIQLYTKEQLTNTNVATIVNAELSSKRIHAFYLATASGTPIKDSSNNVVLPQVISWYSPTYYLDALDKDFNEVSLNSQSVTFNVAYSHKIN